MLLKGKYVIGVMSGTSLDGIDLALCRIIGYSTDTRVEVINYRSYPYSSEIKNKIVEVSFDNTSSVSKISKLHYELGHVYSIGIQKFLKEINFKKKIDLISLHGQTIHHLPSDKMPSTIQIGSASQIAFDLETTVVSNFREMDIVAGGEGAPLVSYTDWLLYRNYEGVILQNIGGIGNLSVVPKGSQLKDIYAFDTGPGNMMINYAVEYFYQESYDKNGDYARQGVVIPELMKELIRHEYLKLEPPKTTGREMFGEDITFDICERYRHRPNDVICTLTEFTAETIRIAVEQHVLNLHDIQKLIISGGGAYNLYLVEAIKKRIDLDVLVQEDLGFSSDAKEAVAFAILGNETIHRVANNAPNATGAKHAVVLGQITLNPKVKRKEEKHI